MIRKLSVKNWKCYTEKTFDFKLGLNYLVGPNGTGKSSILEAISVALTGDHPFGDVRNYVKKGAHNANISVRLDFEGKELGVERVFTPLRKGNSILTYGDKKWEGWDEVTQQVENILYTPSEFIQRIIFITEGEVYRTLDKPPKDILNSQVRRVFGLEQLENSLEILNSLYSLNQRSISKARSIQRQLSEFQDLSPKQLEIQILDLRKKGEDLKKTKQTLESKLEKLNQKLSDLNANRMGIEGSINLAKEFYRELGLEENEETPMNEIFYRQKDNTTKKKKEAEKNYRQVEEDWSKLKLRIGWMDQIISDMSTETREKITLCPTCGKPLSFEDRQKIIKDHVKEREGLSKNEVEMSVRCSQMQSEVEEYKNRLETLLKWEKTIQRDRYISKERLSLGNLYSLYDKIKKEEKVAKEEKITLSEEIKEINESEKNSALQVKENEGTLENVKRVKSVSFGLARDFQKEAVLRTLRYAFGQTLGVVRSTYLQPLFKKLSETWGGFVPFENAQVILSESGDFIIKSNGHELGFEHLSGGEKTVLILLSRLLLTRRLTKLGFILVDEPLEHLDVVCRRSIVKFLRDYCEYEKDFQIVVSTYEENLIRDDIEHRFAKGVFLTER